MVGLCGYPEGQELWEKEGAPVWSRGLLTAVTTASGSIAYVVGWGSVMISTPPLLCSAGSLPLEQDQGPSQSDSLEEPSTS